MKRITVVITAAERERVREALRAAVGLGLRGDRVTVVMSGPAPADPIVDKALATLAQLGQRVVGPLTDDDELAASLAGCDCAEVWS